MFGYFRLTFDTFFLYKAFTQWLAFYFFCEVRDNELFAQTQQTSYCRQHLLWFQFFPLLWCYVV